MLNEGRCSSVSELAAADKLNCGYLARILMLMLTLLTPDIVEAFVDGRQPAELGVHVLREGFPLRDLDNVRGEWSLVTTAWNMKRIFVVAGAI